jgi:hypothetical protein
VVGWRLYADVHAVVAVKVHDHADVNLNAKTGSNFVG